MSAADTEKKISRTYVIPGKGKRIGEGAPGILVSATGRTPEAILEAVKRLAADPAVDGIELRLDHLDSGRNSDQILEITGLVNQAYAAARDKILIATVRTGKEGGEASYTAAEYLRLLGSLIRYSRMDLIDLEVSRGEELLAPLVEAAHAVGIGVIMSSHNFSETPDSEKLRETLELERKLGGDILKLAVMPRKASDVARLLLVTAEAREAGLGPLVTMAMGPLGSISRVSGGIFGSALTFAMSGTASAPGQMAVEDVKRSLGLFSV